MPRIAPLTGERSGLFADGKQATERKLLISGPRPSSQTIVFAHGSGLWTQNCSVRVSLHDQSLRNWHATTTRSCVKRGWK